MPTILVVDDDTDIRKVLRMSLESFGEVVEAANGPEALAQVVAARPDVAVLDVMMPGMSGLDVLAEWRRSPATAGLPVVLLTARDREPDRLNGYRAGADAYLTKPFDVQALCSLVADLLDGGPNETTDLLDVIKGLAELD